MIVLVIVAVVFTMLTALVFWPVIVPGAISAISVWAAAGVTSNRGAPHPHRRRQAPLPRVTIYEFRRTGATLLRSVDTPLDEIQQIMGHSTLEMTGQYAQIEYALQREATDRLDEFFKGLGGTDGGTAN